MVFTLPAPDADTTTERLSLAALAIQSSVPREEIERFVELGLIAQPDEGGTFHLGDVTRLKLIQALRNSGVGLDPLIAAVTERELSLDFAGHFIADPVGLTTITVAEACAETGLDYDAFGRLMLAIGFATPAKDALIREDDLEFLRIYAVTRDLGIPGEVLTGTLRSFAINLRRLAESSRGLVREHVEDRLLASGMPYQEMFETVARMRVVLQRLGYRATYLLQRRLFEQAAYANLIARFEEVLAHHPATDGKALVLRTVCFVDLSGFTERTENLGDADAASVGAALVEIAQAKATLHRGDLVKPLGDGAMLQFAGPVDAIRCALAIVEAVRTTGLPSARVGIAAGPVVVQDGDYYGRTVNRAARLLGIAAPEQVLVTAEIAASLIDTDFRFADLGPVALKGVNEEVHAFAVAEG
jgi:class 3 adenylate cyclase